MREYWVCKIFSLPTRNLDWLGKQDQQVKMNILLRRLLEKKEPSSSQK